MTDKHNIVPAADKAPIASALHPLVERMLTKDPTAETLEKVLTLQRDWEKNEAKKAYDSALVEMKRALPPFLLRDKKVDFTGNSGKRTQYSHTSLAGAMDTVTPILSDYGFSLTWKPGSDDKGQVVVTAKLSHRQGHFDESTLKAMPETGGNKSGPQAVASTVTLLARYACLGLLGLATADMKDPEGEAAPENVERVDTARNMKAMAAIAKAGKSKADAEKVAGKPLTEWTTLELDKVRAWLEPAPTTAPAASTASADPVVSKEEAAMLAAIMKEFKLDPTRFANIIESETKRRPVSIADVRKAEYALIAKAFDAVRVGAANLKGNIIERPPE